MHKKNFKFQISVWIFSIHVVY